MTTSLKDPVPRTARTRQWVGWLKNRANLAKSNNLKKFQYLPRIISGAWILFDTNQDQIFFTHTKRVAKFQIQFVRRWEMRSPILRVDAEGEDSDLPQTKDWSISRSNYCQQTSTRAPPSWSLVPRDSQRAQATNAFCAPVQSVQTTCSKFLNPWTLESSPYR